MKLLVMMEAEGDQGLHSVALFQVMDLNPLIATNRIQGCIRQALGMLIHMGWMSTPPISMTSIPFPKILKSWTWTTGGRSWNWQDGVIRKKMQKVISIVRYKSMYMCIFL